MPNQTFIIPPAFHPARSFLGRWIRAHSTDDRQAESTYVVVAGVSLLAVVLIHVLAWSFLRPLDTGATFAFLAAETIFVLAYAALSFVGHASAITVRAELTALFIARTEGDELSVPYEEIESVSRVDARTYHRHYRRYADTRAFGNRVYDEVLLLRWNGVPIVLGLQEDDLRAVEHLLEMRSAIGHASSHADAV